MTAAEAGAVKSWREKVMCDNLAMTVRELIEKLQTYDPNLPIFMEQDGCGIADIGVDEYYVNPAHCHETEKPHLVLSPPWS